jgi:hypothetical protein
MQVDHGGNRVPKIGEFKTAIQYYMVIGVALPLLMRCCRCC